jgi:hypothetical protein
MKPHDFLAMALFFVVVTLSVLVMSLSREVESLNRKIYADSMFREMRQGARDANARARSLCYAVAIHFALDPVKECDEGVDQ